MRFMACCYWYHTPFAAFDVVACFFMVYVYGESFSGVTVSLRVYISGGSGIVICGLFCNLMAH